ncbi:MAG: DUF6159 family protein [Siculibacillus sp.]
MFKSLRRGFAILTGSWAILRAQPQLILLPIFGLASVAAIVIGGIYAWFTVLQHTAGNSDWTTLTDSPFFWIGLGAVYFSSAFVMIFFNAALVYCAQAAFEEQPVGIGAGLTVAAARWRQILGWAIFTATIGLLVRMIGQMLENLAGDEAGPIGALFGVVAHRLLEVLWVTATLFVMPVLVIEGYGPIGALKRSKELITTRWGEALGGKGGLGIITTLLILPCIGAIVFGAVGLGAFDRPALLPHQIAVALIAAGGVGFCVLSLLHSVLDTIFTTGVYAYAISGLRPGAFDEGTVDASFRSR